MSAGSFTCLRQDCPKDVSPDRLCSRCEMPWVDKPTRAIIQLWNRCKSSNRLPCDGGVFDQPETVMAAFDVIEGVVAEHRKKETQRLDAETANLDRLRRLERGH